MKFASLCLLFWIIWLAAPSQNSNAIQFAGTLGDHLFIELRLDSIGKGTFFSGILEDSVAVKGQYHYRNQMVRMDLEGYFWKQGKRFLLLRGVGEQERERFEGKYDPNSGKLSGTWKQRNSGTQLPFVLKALQANDAEQSFCIWLNTYLTQEPDPIGAAIQEAQWLGTGNIHLEEFQYMYSGYIHFFSPLRLEYHTGYHPMGRSIDREVQIQLVPMTSGRHLLVQVSTEYQVDNDEEDDSGTSSVGMTSSCEGTIQIYRFDQDQWSDVTEALWPTGMDTHTSPAESEESGGCGYIVDSYGVLLPDGRKLLWQGGKLVRQ